MPELTSYLSRMTNAQSCSYRSLQHVAHLAINNRARPLVRVNAPTFLHEGESSVMVLVESWDPCVKSDPEKGLDDNNMMRSERTFLIETGGCIVQVLNA